MTHTLETRGLGKDYRGIAAVESLDLSIDRGEIIGLLGPNGAGKTTTISMIAGVLAPSRGHVSINGHDLDQEPMKARAALGLVPQELAIYLDLSAAENLEFYAGIYGLSGAESRQRIDWALDVVSLRDRRRDRVSEFSGGMKRRLNLAAGLLHRPSLLILDEPTVGVDPQSRKHIFETVRRLRQEHDMSVLYTSHYMEEVEALCDSVAILDGGQVVATGTVSELVSQHAGAVLIIELGDDADPDAALAAAAAAIGSERVELVDHQLEIEVGESSFGSLVDEVERAAGSLRALRTREANLETVFLALTGHTLRD